jgi:hypothetical protein
MLFFWRAIASRIDHDRHFRTAFFGLIALQVIFLIMIVFGVHTLPIADSSYYLSHAQTLVRTGSYTSAFGYPTAFWPIGYPVVLALPMLSGFDATIATRILNLCILITTVVVLVMLFKQYLSRHGIILFALCIAFFPNNLFAVNVLMPDHLFNLLLWITVFLLVRKKTNWGASIAVAILLGLMSYLRPVGILLPIVLLVAQFRAAAEKKRFISLLISLAIVVLLLAPWAYRNYAVFGEFVPVSTNGGYNFLMGNHEGSTGGVNFDFTYDFQDSNEPRQSKLAYQRGLEAILRNPFEAVARIPLKIFHLFYRGDSSITWALKSTQNTLPSWLLAASFFGANAAFYGIVILGFWGMILHWKAVSDSKLRLLMTAVYLYIVLATVVFVGADRYQIPLLPIHMFFAVMLFESKKT